MSIKNIYRRDEQSVVSFSGGRTSGYMLWRILDAYDGKLPDHIKVCFANTGKELPATLDFVRDCSQHWGVNIAWLERYSIRLDEQQGRKMYEYTTKRVTYETAARNGEPFSQLISVRRYAPNPVARFCTTELKIRAIREYLESVGFEPPFTAYIGIRADEARRANKMIGKVESWQEPYLPLFLDGITKHDVMRFWQSQPFDLNLPNNNGTTDWGNCDLCFLKGASKKLAIIRERPDLADWWIQQEASLSKEVGKAAFFRSDQPSYADMKIIATDQGGFDLGFDESIPCFCGD
jgi:3'-phosphoadenosine 5'-phosphosulfate sulfotransferase (PAPS reductase)/FAD synthetase